MSEEQNAPELQVVIEDMLASETELTDQTISRWAARYPQHERALADFAAKWNLLAALPPDESALEDEAGYYVRGLEAVGEVIRAKRAQASAVPEEPVASLLAEARRHDLDAASLAALAELSVPIIIKFEQRLISFGSIPREAVTKVAGAIKRSYESVAAYLRMPPAFAPGASYKSDTAPTLPPQQDFAAEIDRDRMLSAEKKAYWRSLAGRARDAE